MLRRLWRRFRGRDRKIFRFDDGSRRTSIDPLLAAQVLALHPDYIPDHLQRADSGDAAAMQIVAAAACDAFGVTPWNPEDETGLTLTERIDLMLAFDRWLMVLKKNTRVSPTWQPPMAATYPVSKEPTTSDLSPSGPAATARPSAPPTASAWASGQPSAAS